MNPVFFDGTVETAGQVLRACKQIDARVAIVTHRHIDPTEQSFLNRLRDCSGSLGSFKNGRYERRQKMGSARKCVKVSTDGIETFFQIIAGFPNENFVDEILSELRACDCNTCGKCEVCVRVGKYAEKYGFYDIFDRLRERQ